MANTKNKNTKTARSKKVDPALLEFGKRVIEARGDLSQGDFGNAIGMSQGLISTVERGQRVPSKWYGLIAQHYNIVPPTMAQGTNVAASPANTRRSAKRATRAKTKAAPRQTKGQTLSTGTARPAWTKATVGSNITEVMDLRDMSRDFSVDDRRRFRDFLARAQKGGLGIDGALTVLSHEVRTRTATTEAAAPNGRAHAARSVTPRQVAQA